MFYSEYGFLINISEQSDTFNLAADNGFISVRSFFELLSSNGKAV